MYLLAIAYACDMTSTLTGTSTILTLNILGQPPPLLLWEHVLPGGDPHVEHILRVRPGMVVDSHNQG